MKPEIKTYQDLRAAGTQGDFRASCDSIISADNTKCIACIETDGGYEAPEKERRANAQLIAHEHNHFPKLLAALEEIEITLESGKTVWASERTQAAAKIREALTAATNLKASHE